MLDQLHAGTSTIGGDNTDTMIVVHIPADGSSATAISIGPAGRPGRRAGSRRRGRGRVRGAGDDGVRVRGADPVGGNLAALDDVLLLRGVLSPAAHMAWTGLSAAALWIAVDRGLTRSAARFGAVFLVAVGLHTAWDSFNSTWAYVVIAVLSLGLLTVTAHRLGERGEPAPVGGVQTAGSV